VNPGPRTIYAGYFVRCPLGGYAWQVVHYVRGLLDAGADVLYYEDTRHTWQAYDPVARTLGDDYSCGIQRIADLFERAGLADRWVFHDSLRDEYHGRGREAVRAWFDGAGILLNAGGVHRFDESERHGKCTVYIDMDPAYTQLRIAGGDAKLRELVAEHSLHFTFGENIGTERSPIPDAGFEWRPTRQPIVAGMWPESPVPQAAPFTTIGTWNSAGRDVDFHGQRYSWRKRDEWQGIMDLPDRTGESFALAMEVADAGDRATLERAGWEIRDPIGISADDRSYAAFLRASRGEFTTAKDVNVRLRSGWFSDRSACYLAAGRPVVTQDTAFGDVLPTGEGLFSYRSVEDAAAAVRAIAAEPQRHGAAARRIAEEHFAAPVVLGRLLGSL
jgi:glycosyltransferase involved in cell wall biosynthesis